MTTAITNDNDNRNRNSDTSDNHNSGNNDEGWVQLAEIWGEGQGLATRLRREPQVCFLMESYT